MKRRFGTVIAMVLCFILTVVSVYADDGKGQNPDYVTDYYMIVQSTQGGVDIYDEADTQSVKLNDSKIPNGTAIHVLGEKNGVDNKKWAYTQYHGMNGYVPMDDLDPASREEAANEEYRTFGGKDVDFEVKVHGNDGNVSVYNGPGEKFDQVSGTEGIADGTTVHIFQYVQGEDGTNWGKTDTDGVTQGWLNLDRDTDYVNENVSADAPEATGTSGNVPVAAVTPTPEATPTPKATPTPDVTKNGLVTVDGVTYYYIKGVVQENYTGFVKSNSIQYYVKAGIVQAAYKGLVTSSKTGNIWLVKNGMVYSSYIGFYKNAKGQQCYIYKGKFQNAKSGFAKSPKTGKIYYIRKGIVQYGYTGFIKNPASGNQCYVVKGVFQGSKTGVVKSPKTGVKYYVKSGRVSYKTTGIVKISGVKYKVVKGVVKGIVK